MKILFGVQATGNGHITRARALAKQLEAHGLSVQWLFSGRPAHKLFDMAVFGNYWTRQGMTFVTEGGRLNPLKTLQQARVGRVIKEIKQLPVGDFDLVISDFEPITAWAAKRGGVRSVAIGHQYAFAHQIPLANDSAAGRAVMRWFAPADVEVGLHWHHFNQPILPPLIEPSSPTPAPLERVLVYLPFESAEQVMALLTAQAGQFEYFTDALAPGCYGNVRVHGFGRESFQAQLHRCGSVLSNAGFELASEALQLGRRLLVKPVAGQMEQLANARALSELGYGWVMPELDAKVVANWFRNGQAVTLSYPDVASTLAVWLADGARQPVAQLSSQLWRQSGITAYAGQANQRRGAQMA